MKLNKKFALVPIAAAVMALGASFSAFGQNYTFDCITNNSATNCTAAEAQLGLQLINQGTSVDFKFTNAGPLPSSITDIYFDWSGPAYQLNAGTITDSGAGVSFSWGASPSNLPGGNTISFFADSGADSNSPTQPNGVNPGEWINFNFNGSYATLSSGLNNGNLRVGLHVQGFANGGSESVVTVTTAIPEPETYAMLLAGLGLMGIVGRRRRRRAGA